MNYSDRLINTANASLEAEDHIISYLGKYAKETAAAIAVRAEHLLGLRWETELRDMMRRAGPSGILEREAIVITVDDLADLRRVFVTTDPGKSDATAEQHVVDLVSKLPADRAWWCVHRVAAYTGAQIGISRVP